MKVEGVEDTKDRVVNDELRCVRADSPSHSGAVTALWARTEAKTVLRFEVMNGLPTMDERGLDVTSLPQSRRGWTRCMVHA